MEITKTIGSVRMLVKAARSEGRKVGFVPTMGALHVGHISLIEAAVTECDCVVVSIFVNPTQFGPGEDFEKYPRPLEADLDICRKCGVDAVFVPTPEQMYPTENITWVNVEKLTETLCGASRPGHFRGVATVCAKLFNIVGADVAYFGQKDAQQAVVIKRMVADLNIPVDIVVCPTVREESGLAVSSRNKYLTEEQKKDATLIYKSLQNCREMIEAGTTDIGTITTDMRKILSQAPSIQIEYVSIVDAESLQKLDKIIGKVLAAVAVRIGPARLIDNIVVDIK
ncbi:MAG: pantoate--beta-alanine ligase [Phycisphaerae bacterium]|nr:pantoate--beta-alanine ligase [Phycisphaerae bacterium]NIW72258.1 pantoate--beta-alanine ligase [candidate division KSB1 bacterium]NIP56308.1 pantoate--beta-alanine ligase [Phycisphaerae bacterium]NIS49681.1 pantoate--beta-alanine ligase [Phycisphaerae bacterium]NIU07412.1 pantoate--beta-alanine ligase [Phycisphaerae bacterium]